MHQNEKLKIVLWYALNLIFGPITWDSKQLSIILSKTISKAILNNEVNYANSVVTVV